jgi:hypothetical protein
MILLRTLPAVASGNFEMASPEVKPAGNGKNIRKGKRWYSCRDSNPEPPDS